MRLYFLRHGPALSRSQWAGTDVLRPLSAAGEEVVRQVTDAILGLDLGVEVIVTSPYERALATARVAHETLALDTPLAEDARLEPHRFTFESLGEMLSGHAGARAVMVVGHEPSMTDVLSDVVGGGSFVLKKGGLARIDLVDAGGYPHGELRWLLPPRMLRR